MLLYLFLDTNVFLQCKDLYEIPWQQIRGETDFILVVPRCIVTEIDRLKNDGSSRRARRARKTASLFDSVLEAKDEIKNIRPQKPSVSIILAHPLPIDWENYPQLNPIRIDDNLVVEAMTYASSNRDVMIVSHDFGPRHTAREQGVKYFKVPDDWLLPPEHDERDKRIQQLEKELSILKSTQPDIDIKLQSEDGVEVSQYTLTVQRVPKLSDAEIEVLTEFVRTKYAMQEFVIQPKNIDPLNRGTLSRFGSFGLPPPELVRRYQQEKYPQFLEEVRHYFQMISSRLEYWTRLLPFSIHIENRGRQPALNMILNIEAYGDFLLLNKPPDEKEDFQLPEPPKPPLGAAIFGLQNTFAPPSLFGQLHLPHQYDPTAFSWKGGPPYADPTGTVTCDEFRHQTQRTIYLHIMAPPKLNLDHVRGAICIKFSASNLPKPVERTVQIKLTSQPGDICQVAHERGLPQDVCLALEKIKSSK